MHQNTFGGHAPPVLSEPLEVALPTPDRIAAMGATSKGRGGREGAYF